MQYSHRKAGQPGKFTRLMSCTPEEYERLSEAERNLMPTHVAPSYTKHPRTGGRSAGPAAGSPWPRGSCAGLPLAVVTAPLLSQRASIPAINDSRLFHRKRRTFERLAPRR